MVVMVVVVKVEVLRPGDGGVGTGGELGRSGQGGAADGVGVQGRPLRAAGVAVLLQAPVGGGQRHRPHARRVHGRRLHHGRHARKHTQLTHTTT